MPKALVVVESPAKIKTLKKFLGSNYHFESSIGHIRDLPQKGFGIDIENNFEPTYEVMEEKKNVANTLISASKKVDVVYLAPDPDREGEAIAWHIAALLPDKSKIRRISFNAITKEAVQEALHAPRNIDLALVDAQQARRLLDRMVGYSISPILARKIQRGRGLGSVSAGRVQSIALKFVVDREKEIEAFVPVEYWNLSCQLITQDSKEEFTAYLHSVDGKKVEKELDPKKQVFLINNETIATSIQKDLENQTYQIAAVTKKEKKRHPAPPFITSTLQQEASRHYGFSSVKTMSIAQSLYEGVDIGSAGSQGLITYMRTDSVRIEPSAIQEIRGFISSKFPANHLPEKPRVYASKKTAQDAHEAIRPASLEYAPDQIAQYLTNDQERLYRLIWNRAIASQMASAVYDTLSCDIEAGKYLLRATGSVLKFRGHLAIYEEKYDEEKSGDSSKNLPDLHKDQNLNLLEALSEQSFTKPPPRYTEALLVKELEKSGVGRPSTYASIMRKIQSREYTTREKGRLVPTELGRVIAQMLEDHFKQIMDISFTALMEDELEQVAKDEKEWKSVLKEFWDQFAPTVELAKTDAFVPKLETKKPCPKCQKPLLKIWSKNKYFYGCSGYPDCDFSTPIEQLDFDKEKYNPDFEWDQKCPKCSSDMTLRHGRFGPFLGCSTYPECKGIINIPKKGEELPDEKDLPSCPAIGCDGNIVIRRSRYGKPFYACSSFPDCNVIVNQLDELNTKYADHPKTAYVRKTKKGKKKATKSSAKKKVKKTPTKRVPKEFNLSDELKDFLGQQQATRPDALKKVWEYIKENDLQNPKDKREIIPDAKLEKILGQKEPINMFQMTKVLSAHFLK